MFRFAFTRLMAVALVASTSAKVLQHNQPVISVDRLGLNSTSGVVSPTNHGKKYLRDRIQSVFTFDDDFRAHLDGGRARRAEIDRCSFDVPCSDAKTSKCCKSCQIGPDKYSLDSHTFHHTLSRGSKKVPRDDHQNCGVEQNKGWPADKTLAVGVLQAPYEFANVGGLPLYEPDEIKHPRSDVLKEYTASNVLFVKHSYKLMHQSTLTALNALAREMAELSTTMGLLVVQGYEPIPFERPNPEIFKDALYYEARELRVVFYVKGAGGCSKCLASADTEETGDFNTYAVKYVGSGEVPTCLTDATTPAARQACVESTTLVRAEINYRTLADYAYKRFDFVEHSSVPFATASGVDTYPLDSVVMSMRDHHRACGATADIAFLLDGSGSVGPDGWRDQLKFVKDFTASIKPSEDTAQIAVATFAGPRFSHFADHYDHFLLVAETDAAGKEIFCTSENDCPHSVFETEGLHGAREVCKVDPSDSVQKCMVEVPEHCPVGTLYEMGNKKYGGDEFSYGCICASGSTCGGQTYKVDNPTGCRTGYFRLNDNSCGTFTDAENVAGATINVGEHDASANPDCESSRDFFTHDCKGCECSGDDYTWDESHSSWTNFNFKDHASSKEMHAFIDAGTPQADATCPVLGHGGAHEAVEYDAFHGRDDFCWADGASHLSMGLKHVLVGNGDGANRDQYGMYDSRNGGRPGAGIFTPRVLIVLTDGKSNPHFEPDAWIGEIFAQNIEVFAVGMGDRDGIDLDDAARRDYKKELDIMASEPLDTHRFDVKGAGHLNEILLHLTDGLCELPTVFPPGGFEIDPQLDEGQSQNYQVSCEEMTGTVFVMVDTTRGHAKVFVSGDVREPSEFNKGANGQEDVSKAPHKVIKFTGGAQLEASEKLYIGVTNGDSQVAQFKIQLYLDVFVDGEKEMEGADVDGMNAGDVIFAPALKAGFGSLSDWTISVAATGSTELNNKGYFAYTVGKGITVTTAGAAAFKVQPFVIGSLELVASHNTKGSSATTPGCLNGFLRISFTHTLSTFPVEWGQDKYTVDDLLEYAEAGILITAGRARRDIIAANGAELATVTCTGCIRYEIEDGNVEGTFELTADGTLKVKNAINLDADSGSGAYDITVVAYNDNTPQQVSDSAVHIEITVKNVEEKPFFKMCREGDASEDACISQLDGTAFNIADVFAGTNVVAVGGVIFELEIMNPGRLPYTELACSRQNSQSDITVERGPESDVCLAAGQGCMCVAKKGATLNVKAVNETDFIMQLHHAPQGASKVEQDSHQITLRWDEQDGTDDGTGDGDDGIPEAECVDLETNAKVVELNIDLSCAEAAAGGYCSLWSAAVELNNTVAPNFEDDKTTWQTNVVNVITDHCKQSCNHICSATTTPRVVTADEISNKPCNLVELAAQCGGADAGECVESAGSSSLPGGPPAPGGGGDGGSIGGPPAPGGGGDGGSIGGSIAPIQTWNCECKYPFFGNACQEEADPTLDPCAPNEGNGKCLNGGKCFNAKSTGSDFWDTSVCQCQFSEPNVCWAGEVCSLKVEDCPAGTISCLARPRSIPGVCSPLEPCVPSFSNDWCLPTAMKNNLRAEVETTPDPASFESAATEADGKKSNVVAIVVPLILLFILIVCVVLFLLNKKKQTNDTISALQSSRGQSRSGTTTRTPAAARGQPPNQVVKLTAGQSNMMYDDMSGGMDAVHENDGQVYGGDSSYGDVGAATSGYSDVTGKPVMSIGNAMYDAAAGAGSGVYDAASQPYMDIAPNGGASQQAYMDIAPEAGGEMAGAYMDIAPEQGGVRPMDNPTYNAVDTGGSGVYDAASSTYQAGAGGSTVYDTAAGSSTMYDTAAGGNAAVYDAAAGGNTAMYDTAA